MTRHKGIIAYGTDSDREKLAILAETYQISGSEFIIRMIREKFETLYGEKHEDLQSNPD